MADGYHVIGPSGVPGRVRSEPTPRRPAAGAVGFGGDRARMNRQIDAGDLGRR